MKKSVAMILTCSLAICGLAGCGGTGGTQASNGGTQTNNDTEQNESNVVESQEEETASDEMPQAGGQTLRIMMSSGDFGADTIKPALEKAAEVMGISIEYDVIPDDQMLNVANTQLATGNADDIIYIILV